MVRDVERWMTKIDAGMQRGEAADEPADSDPGAAGCCAAALQ